MSDFVCDDIGEREVAFGAELAGHVVVEGQVKIDLLIGRAIERSDRALREAARRIRRVAEEDERRQAIGFSGAREDAGPHIFGVGQNDANEFFALGFFRRLLDRAGLLSRRLRAGAFEAAQSVLGSTPKTSAKITTMIKP